MLNYKSIGPTAVSEHLVVYQTPGCQVPTVACVCRTAGQAACEAERLNLEQINREKCLQAERLACGLGGTYYWLDGGH